MKFFNEQYSIKDLTFVGITSALCIVVGVIVRGLLGILIGKVPGLENLVLGVAQGVILVMGLIRVNKRYFLTLVGLSMGAVYGFVFPGHPFLFVTFFVAGLMGDMMMFLPFKKIKPIISVIVFRVSSGALGVLLAYWIGFSQTKLVWSLMLINTAAMAIGAIIGTYLGMKLYIEIQKTGFIGFKGNAINSTQVN